MNEKAIEDLKEKRIIKTEEEMDRVHYQIAKDRGLVDVWSALTSIRSQVNIFLERQPMFYDKSGLWWIWDNENDFYELTDETEILLRLSDHGRDTISSKSKSEILEALRQEGRKRIPKPFQKNWIQFKNEIINIYDGSRINASPIWFCTNPLPYKIGKSFDTPTIDKLFIEWVGEKDKDFLYELIAYCCLADYPLHRIFCLIGSGSNGKSTYMNLIKRFIGIRNICSVDLERMLQSRFEITKLHKKLVCFVGETNFNEITHTSTLKRLSGGDLIGFEYKNKLPFDDENYAKIIISTNNLPTTTDKTLGYYRRWIIKDFPNMFRIEDDVLSKIPEEEFENLSYKVVTILNNLLISKKFTNEGTIEERMQRYEEKSNPFEKFWKENVDEDLNADIPNWEFAKFLNEWCKTNKFREIGDRTIASFMKEKHIETRLIRKEWFDNGFQTSKPVRCWVGIKWKN